MKAYNIFITATALALCACGDSDTQYDASGVFESTEIIVSAKSAGEIQSLKVEEGQQVDKGRILGFIDCKQLVLQKDRLVASKSETDSRRLDENRQLAALRRQINNLQRERKRFAELLKANAATAKQVDDIDYQIEVLKRQLDATQEQISSNNSSLSNRNTGIEAEVAQVDDKINNTLITSPIRGTVLSKYAEEGEYAVPGRALFKVSDVSLMRLRAYITAEQLTVLKLGAKVKVYADLGKDSRKQYDGTVTWISDKAEFTPKTIQTRDERANLVYAIKVDVKNDGLIKRGMYGDVKF